MPPRLKAKSFDALEGNSCFANAVLQPELYGLSDFEDTNHTGWKKAVATAV